MKKIILLTLLIIAGCETTTEQRCKFLLNEQEEYVEMCR